MKPCVFFDRDGVVNEAPAGDFVLSWEAFKWQPGFIDTLKVVSRRGIDAVVVTNQSCIARGLATVAVIEDIHARLQAQLRDEHGLGLLDILYCPSLDNADPMRKPNPGMLQEAARRHDLDLPASWMIGDQERDIDAGRRAGCKTIRVSAVDVDTAADYLAADMMRVQSLLDRLLP